LPTNDDWDELFLWIDEQNGGNGEGIPYDSYTAGKYLKAANGWDGTNKYGFSALPGGLGGYDGSFDGAGSGGFWWSSSAFYDEESELFYFYFRAMGSDSEAAMWLLENGSNFMSVRCVSKAVG